MAGTTLAPEAMALIIKSEGYLRRLNDGTDRVVPYRCPANVPTIGYGTTFYETRRKVRMDDPPITRHRATELLQFEIAEVCEAAMRRLIKRDLHPLAWGAIASFTFNCGTGALAKSTLLKRINAAQWRDVPREFRKWTRGGGRSLKGLEVRRAAEAAMFMRGVALAGSQATSPKPPPVPTRKPAPAASWWSSLKEWIAR